MTITRPHEKGGFEGATPGVRDPENALRVGLGTGTLDILPEQTGSGVLGYYHSGEAADVSKHELPARFVVAIASFATATVPTWNTPYWAR